MVPCGLLTVIPDSFCNLCSSDGRINEMCDTAVHVQTLYELSYLTYNLEDLVTLQN